MNQKIKKLVVHCSASPQGRGDQAADIHRWHLEKQFDGIGYHYVILENGEVQTGRPEYWAGAHVRWHNIGSLGIVLIGQGADATNTQLSSLRQLLNGLQSKYPTAVAMGHSDLDPEGKPDCPGFDVKNWYHGV